MGKSRMTLGHRPLSQRNHRQLLSNLRRLALKRHLQFLKRLPQFPKRHLQFLKRLRRFPKRLRPEMSRRQSQRTSPQLRRRRRQ